MVGHCVGLWLARGFGNILSYVVVIGLFVHRCVISVSLDVFGFSTSVFANCAYICHMLHSHDVLVGCAMRVLFECHCVLFL